MLRRARANSGDEFPLQGKPAVAVFHHRLVDDFKKDAFGITSRQMLGQSSPEFTESFDLTITAIQFFLEFIRRMDINDYGQLLRQNHVKRVVEITEVVCFQSTWIVCIEERCRLKSEAYMIKADLSNERNVLGRGV